jgi:hypothetical protein
MKQRNCMLDDVDVDKMKRVSYPAAFVLIKEYPLSPKIGTVVVHRHGNQYEYVEGHVTYGIDLNVLKSNPEFWGRTGRCNFSKTEFARSRK